MIIVDYATDSGAAGLIKRLVLRVDRLLAHCLLEPVKLVVDSARQAGPSPASLLSRLANSSGVNCLAPSQKEHRRGLRRCQVIPLALHTEQSTFSWSWSPILATCLLTVDLEPDGHGRLWF